jgi:hypothetical protein
MTSAVSVLRGRFYNSSKSISTKLFSHPQVGTRDLFLRESLVELDVVGSDGQNPLHVAAAHGQVDVVRALARESFNLTAEESSKTRNQPSSVAGGSDAAATGRVENNSSRWKQNPVSYVGMGTRTGTPLHWAAACGQVESARVGRMGKTMGNYIVPHENTRVTVLITSF